MINDLSISQNFIKSKDLIRKILSEKTSIKPDDIVLDIGAGKGALTIPLSKVSKKVIAYEYDSSLANELNRNLIDFNNVKIIEGDFLKSALPTTEYKVFSNIPFSLSADIVNKLFLDENPPLDAYIFFEKGAGYRFLGLPYSKESVLSMKLKCGFKGEIVHQFSKFDFQPIPDADIILVRFLKIPESNKSFASFEDETSFVAFITRVFYKNKHILKNALETEFTFNQIKRIKKDLKLDLTIPPSQLDFTKWVEIYRIARLLKHS